MVVLAAALAGCGGTVGGDGDAGGARDGGGGEGGPDGGAPISTPVMPILEGDGFYPRAIQLAGGTIMASIVSPQASGRLGGTILESTDDGVTFEVAPQVWRLDP